MKMRGRQMRPLGAVLLLLVLAAGGACSDSDGGGPSGGGITPPPDGKSLFVEGCPAPGRARAARIERPDLGMQGPQALGKEGDFLLMNDRAAFIVTGPGNVDTYWYYGGILVDAVALDGCEQAGPERYEELWPLAARIDLLELLNGAGLGGATVRGFRGDRVEILDDGAAGGDAVVRVHGSDDFFWQAEYRLMAEAFLQGTSKAMSGPLGLGMEVDYVLPPDSPVLRVIVRYRNLLDQPQEIVPAACNLFGPTTEVGFYNLFRGDIAGFDFKLGVPWLTAVSDGAEGAWAFAMEDAVLMNGSVAGVDAALDARSFFAPLRLGAAGAGQDTAQVTYFLSVGPTDGNSAERPLRDASPRAFPWAPYEWLPVAGTTFDGETGEPIAGVRVEVEARDLDGAWRPLHRMESGPTGAFGGSIADFGDPRLEYRVSAHAQGRPDPEPALFTTVSVRDFPIPFAADGELAYDVRDGEDRGLPARITLWQDGRLACRILTAGSPGRSPVAPGVYEVSVTRGFEYATYQGSITVAPRVAAPLDVRLERVVDTSGFMAMDGHLHAAPSPDSQVSIPDRILTAASEGVEVAAGTDHEYVGSWQSGIDETGLGEWVATVTGCELTAEVPEHFNLYGLEPRFDLDGRGGFIRWYRMDMAEILAAARGRGARLVAFNHPNYLRLIGYDRLNGRPALDDPTAIGLKPDAELMSWDFDLVELMNGHENPFVRFGARPGTGRFDDWMSFLNLGHPKTATGNTDLHGMDAPGQPRIYFASSTDEPAALDEDELFAALAAGRALVSDGAFARVTIDGSAGLGDLVTDTDGSVDLAIRIEGIPEIDLTHFVVFVNCDEALAVAASDPAAVVKYDAVLSVPVARDAHVVIAGFGANPLPRGLDSFEPEGVPRFVTNAVYVDADGNGAFDPPGGKECSYDLR
ncbi:MAG: CehA/McbA family metallohydrolase [bacterium]